MSIRFEPVPDSIRPHEWDFVVAFNAERNLAAVYGPFCRHNMVEALRELAAGLEEQIERHDRSALN